MASLVSAAWCAALCLAFWTALGYPVTRSLLEKPMALPCAPLAGWAVHSVIALLLLRVLPFSTFWIITCGVICMAAALAILRLRSASDAAQPHEPVDGVPEPASSPSRVSWVPALALVLAAFISVGIAAAIAPKTTGSVVRLSDPIFDHAKIAIVDDIARLGVPPGNPFLLDEGGSGRLAYYYLLHFSAAEWSHVLGVTGWEADVALTFFAAFACLGVMMSLAVTLSNRAAAGYWVLLMALTSSARRCFEDLIGKRALEPWLPTPGGFGGWFFQSAWVPQHLISAGCVLLALYLFVRLAERPTLVGSVLCALLIAAGFESSTWIGGVTFAVTLVPAVPLIIMSVKREARRPVAVALAGAAILVVLIVWPFVVDQLLSATRRQAAPPIAVRIFPTLGQDVPQAWRAIGNEPAFWLLLLPFELTASYVMGLLFVIKGRAWVHVGGSARRLALVLGASIVTSFLVAGTLANTLSNNNDLAWRAGLLGASGLIVAAAVGLSYWWSKGRWVPLGVALVAFALGLPETAHQLDGHLTGQTNPDGAAFGESAQMWAAVRAQAGPAERVANNPRAFADMTPWPVNISWSLLADRRSCYAGWELAQVYSSIPHAQLYQEHAQFVRVFSGEGSGADVASLAGVYDCAVVVVTASDGAWKHDPFRDSPLYSLADEEKDRWRIYRRSDHPRDPEPAPVGSDPRP
jgi:hypothetical protein